MKVIKNSQTKAGVNISKVRRRREIDAKCAAMKIPTGIFTGDELDKIYTQDEKEFIQLLNKGEEIPKELEQRLIESMPEREERNREENLRV